LQRNWSEETYFLFTIFREAPCFPFYIFCIFEPEFHTMFEFDQYLGFLAFLSILTIGFWLMIFLITFVIPYWLFGSLMERFKTKKTEDSSGK